MSAQRLKWGLLIILALIWGSSFILIKRGLVALTPFQLGSLRIVFAAVFLLVIGLKSLTLIPLGKWKFIILTALCGTFLPVYLFSFAQTEINSSVSAILNSLTPLYTLLLGAFVFGLTFARRQFFGVVIGLIGCMLLIFNGAINNPGQNYYYAILVVIASICYALNVNLIKKHLSDLSPLSITTGNFAVLLIPALVVLSFTDFFSMAAQPEVQHSVWFILILGVVGTGIANIIFFKLIQMSSPIFASSVTYLIPIVAFFWGLVDNESLTLVQFFGAFIILFGVYLSAKK
ncbi:DMT family transporter [Flavobacterium sp. GT3R68]|uniref:DMT family transporter n=1 Tax=Flavobacterium sp. GT3R68 TaxID=2594437 RepID=UPI000F897CB5|nr:EamA family transporter [Flavobacterium sp. GT3R68]RTY93992.1 permease [Flavobacterium sp. GSN2]TRW93394.1 EamA family transporter [Flavobacterium sp. GT3R68]